MYPIKALFSEDILDFRRNIMDQDVDLYEHPLLYEDTKCSSCDKEQNFYSALNNGWWIDELHTNCRDFPKSEPADICLDCRNEAQILHGEYVGEGPGEGEGAAQCSRCTRYGEHGEGKWNLGPEETGRLIICHSCNRKPTVFCYECHGRIHYNK